MPEGPISLFRLEVGHQRVLDIPEGLGVEVEPLPHPDEASIGHQHLVELVPLIALDPVPGQRLLRARRRRPGLAIVGLEPVDHALLIGAQPDRMRGEAHLVALAPDHALGLETRQELGEDPLLRVAGAAPELLARDPRPQRIVGVKGLEESEGLGPQPVIGVPVEVPLAVHREQGACLHPFLEQPAELVRAERRARQKIGRPRARRAGLAEVLLQNLSGRALVEKLQMCEQRRALSLEARRRDVEQVPPPIVTMGE